MDRLGLNAIDISITVAKLEQLGIKVHCLTLGGVDLTSPAGKMTMGVINHVTQFKRDCTPSMASRQKMKVLSATSSKSITYQSV